MHPAERMGVVATAALDASGPQPLGIEVAGLVDTADRELADFRAITLGDPVLIDERSRLASAMAAIIPHMRRVRAILVSDGRGGLASATTSLLDALKGIPSAAHS
ncbi:MAG: hypothetical protein EXQ74_01040 [Thermoleophilia bacterium]|nr:hypothetical protein [Thermoleophilia bacterium]